MSKKKEIKPSKAGKKKVQPDSKSNLQVNWRILLVLGAIVLISCIIYLPVLHNEFLFWDDDYYIRDNPLIYSFNLKEIFSHNVMGNYHPFTILTLATEYHLFGLNPAGYHAFNLSLHLLNVILVFYAVFLLCDKTAVALVASLLFGIHPIHVESVAWAAELKDLLYTFFFLAAYISYQKYIRAPKNIFYFAALFLFLLSLLSKAMAASLPVILILTDYYKERKITTKTIFEKVPFFILAIILGIVAVAAQKSEEILQDVTYFTFPQRIVFACYGFITYLSKFLIPLHLSAYYPYPAKNGTGIPLKYYGYVLLLIALVAYCIYSIRSTKKIFFGIGFFAITVFLVLQLLPIGDAVMADRYSYVPTIGLCYLSGEGLYFLWNKNLKWLAILILGAFTIFFSMTTYARSLVWKNNMSLWEDTVQKFQTIPLAYYNRGLSFMNENKLNEALQDYNKAIELKPGYNEAYVNRGNIERGNGKYEEALNDYNKAIEVRPDFAIAYFNRGILYMNQQKNDEALSDFTKAIELKPTYYKAYSNRGVIYNNAKRYEDAIREYSKAIEIKPDYFEAYYNRGMAKYYSGDKNGGCADLKQSADLGFKTAADALPKMCN